MSDTNNARDLTATLGQMVAARLIEAGSERQALRDAHASMQAGDMVKTMNILSTYATSPGYPADSIQALVNACLPREHDGGETAP